MKPHKKRRERQLDSEYVHRPSIVRPHLAQEVRELNGGAIDGLSESLVRGLLPWARVNALGIHV